MLSVIIPNYNGERFVDAIISALDAQTLPREKYEIIFVDNGSHDKSLECLQAYERSVENCRVLSYLDIQSSYAARNYGVEFSNAATLVFTDIDCIPEPDWLDRIVAVVEMSGSDCLISGCVELFPRGARFTASEWYDAHFFLDQKSYSKNKTGATANLVVSKSLFSLVGGFKPVISGGDRDFCARVASHAGKGLIYYPEIKVLHPARNTETEIRNKLDRVAFGIATLAYQNHGNRIRLSVVLKLIVTLFFQLHQMKKILLTLQKKSWLSFEGWTFSLFILRMGWYQRVLVLKYYLSSSARFSGER